jgi:hypothetical protein
VRIFLIIRTGAPALRRHATTLRRHLVCHGGCMLDSLGCPLNVMSTGSEYTESLADAFMCVSSQS